MEVCWESSFGECGTFVTPTVSRPILANEDIVFEFVDLPKIMEVGRTQDVTLKVLNMGKVDVELKVSAKIHTMQGIKIQGRSGQVRKDQGILQELDFPINFLYKNKSFRCLD
jgi:hypothetical protein